MFHKKTAKEEYDRENLKPVIRSSICTGERTAGKGHGGNASVLPEGNLIEIGSFNKPFERK